MWSDVGWGAVKPLESITTRASWRGTYTWSSARSAAHCCKLVCLCRPTDLYALDEALLQSCCNNSAFLFTLFRPHMVANNLLKFMLKSDLGVLLYHAHFDFVSHRPSTMHSWQVWDTRPCADTPEQATATRRITTIAAAHIQIVW